MQIKMKYLVWQSGKSPLWSFVHRVQNKIFMCKQFAVKIVFGVTVMFLSLIKNIFPCRYGKFTQRNEFFRKCNHLFDTTFVRIIEKQRIHFTEFFADTLYFLKCPTEMIGFY